MKVQPATAGDSSAARGTISRTECLSAQTTLSAEVRGLVRSTEYPLYLVGGVFLRRGMHRLLRSSTSSCRSYSFSETPRLSLPGALLPSPTRAAAMVRRYYTAVLMTNLYACNNTAAAVLWCIPKHDKTARSLLHCVSSDQLCRPHPFPGLRATC